MGGVACEYPNGFGRTGCTLVWSHVACTRCARPVGAKIVFIYYYFSSENKKIEIKIK
jgi:hypothetical protein